MKPIRCWLGGHDWEVINAKEHPECLEDLLEHFWDSLFNRSYPCPDLLRCRRCKMVIVGPPPIPRGMRVTV